MAERPGRRRLRHLRPGDRGPTRFRRSRLSRWPTRTSPFFLRGAFQGFTSLVRDEPKIREAFKTGAGVGWHEHSHDLFDGTERFFRSGYNAHLVAEWIPALDGVEDKLRLGCRVADVGCGLGASTILMAKAFPDSEFAGFDYHAESIEAARARAKAAGVADRVRFEVAPASEFTGTYDLVTMFDCLHDMGDPVGARATCSARSTRTVRG